MSTRRISITYIRDVILFVLGITLILKQAGIVLPPPAGGPSIELLGIGALFCNGPLFLQWYALRRGIPGSSAEAEQSESASPSLPPSGHTGGNS